MTNNYSEYILIEQPTIALFEALGWETTNCYRETNGEVVLIAPLRPAQAVLII